MTVYDVVTATIIDKLKSGKIPWFQPWSASEDTRPYNAVSGKNYNGINALLLAFEKDNAFVTMNQASAMGGQIARGSKSHPVVFWKVGEVTDKKTGEVKKSFLLRYYKVFCLSDVVGADEKVAKLRRVSGEKNSVPAIEAAQAIVDGYKDSPVVVRGGDTACYSPATDVIRLPKAEAFVNAERMYSTMFHEMAHSTGHESRLNRKIANTFGSKEYAREELVAELAAAFLCTSASIDMSKVIDSSAAYIQSWIQNLSNDSQAIVFAASKASKAAEYILGTTAAEVTEAQ